MPQFESALPRLTVGGLKHPGLPLNLPPFGVENKEYENKSQPIDHVSSYIAIYNWTYQVMDSPTLYNLGFIEISSDLLRFAEIYRDLLRFTEIY